MEIIWKAMGITAVVLLIGFWRRRNAVWGGFMAGIAIGLMVAIVFFLRNNSFNWLIIGKAAILGTVMGFMAELLGKVADFLKRK